VALLEVRNVSKSFGAIHAVNDISWSIEPGEVVGLMGDNGAGKSTLVKLIAGNFPPTDGEVLVDGEVCHFHKPIQARTKGIEVVYQDLALAPDLTIAESMFLGHERMARRWRRLGVIDRKTMGAEAAAAIRRLGVSLPAVGAAIGSLSGGQRQAVAIARAVRWAENVLLMDEPTAALGVRQTEIVTNVIRAAADSGLGVLVISHDMPHMLRTADRIAVLRHGVVVADLPAEHLTITKIVEFMLGLEEAGHDG